MEQLQTWLRPSWRTAVSGSEVRRCPLQ